MRIIILLFLLTFLFTPLMSAKGKGDIRVYCDKGFKISLDGEYKGTKKRKKKFLLIEDVLKGEHILEFIKKGFVRDTIHVLLNKSLLKIDLNKIIADKNIIAIKAVTNSSNSNYDRDEYFRVMQLDVDSTVPIFNETTEYLIQNGGESIPSMIKYLRPKYPESMMKSGKMGTVSIHALVGFDGNVIKAIVGKSSNHPALDNAAKFVAKKNLFIPAVFKNKRINAWVTYKVDFKLVN